MDKLSDVAVTKDFAEQELYTRKVKSITHMYHQPPKAFIRTYGCQQNFSDSERIRGMVVQMGYEICDTADTADLIVFNTCAIRENAEDRVFGNVGALKHLKAKKPTLSIILCGCMVQQEAVAQRMYKTFPFVDLIFGTHMLYKLPQMMFDMLMRCERAVDISIDENITENLPVWRDSTFTANISVMYGCNNFCTYCIVPYVRGRERSRAADDIVAEFKQCLDAGYKEFWLLGQNVNSYGKSSDIDFPKLLKMLDNFDGDYIINYMTSHPKDCTEQLIDTVAESKHISHHLHLPVQSGSNRILKLMNRGYTREKYLSLVSYAKAKIPDLSLTTDIIVGFPGESYEDFTQTLSLMREVVFDSAFTFIYSRRTGTAAAEMDDPVSDEEKNSWFKELLEVQAQVGGSSYHKYVGETMKVLCTGKGRTDERLLTGKSKQGIIVDFAGDNKLIGEFVEVKITEALNWALIGTITE